MTRMPFGKHKGELIVRPEAWQQLCRDAIEQYVTETSVEAYAATLRGWRAQARGGDAGRDPAIRQRDGGAGMSASAPSARGSRP